MSEHRSKHSKETAGPSKPTAETASPSNPAEDTIGAIGKSEKTAESAVDAQEKTNPIAAAVTRAYEARKEQLATYANSGRFPAFAVKEIEAKLDEVVKEQTEWERASGRGGD